MQDAFIAFAISQLGASDKDIRVAAALLRLLASEPELYVREAITWALVRLGRAAIAPLIEMLSSSDPSARHHAAHVLGKMGSADTVDDAVDEVVDPLIKIEQFGGIAINPLIDALEDTRWRVRRQAAEVLGLIADERATCAL